ncbi:MAG: hypothetical protein ACLR2K_04835 [Paraclostridium sordellii]
MIKNYKIYYENKLINKYVDDKNKFKILDNIEIKGQIKVFDSLSKDNLIFESDIFRNTVNSDYISYKANCEDVLSRYIKGILLGDVYFPMLEMSDSGKKFDEICNSLYVEIYLEAEDKGRIEFCSSELLKNLYKTIKILDTDCINDFNCFLDILEKELILDCEKKEFKNLKDKFIKKFNSCLKNLGDMS